MPKVSRFSLSFASHCTWRTSLSLHSKPPYVEQTPTTTGIGVMPKRKRNPDFSRDSDGQDRSGTQPQELANCRTAVVVESSTSSSTSAGDVQSSHAEVVATEAETTSMGEQAVGTREELLEEYKRLTNELLPEEARRHTGVPGLRWPIRLNHCFQRVILDNLFHDVWYAHLSDTPASPQAQVADPGSGLAASDGDHGHSVVDLDPDDNIPSAPSKRRKKRPAGTRSKPPRGAMHRLSAKQLEQALVIGRSMLAGGSPVVRELNERSLEWRGKQRGRAK